MKKLSIQKIIGIIVAVIIILGIFAVIIITTLNVDSFQAQEIALKKTNGGEIVSEEISREFLFNEYSYTIVNGDKWYSIEIDSFGNITEMETNLGQYPIH